jgi:hypothetical protein
MNEQLLNKVQSCNIKEVMQRKGYAFFEKGKYNLNLIGIRAQRSDNINKDTFDDLFMVIYNDESGKEVKLIIPITTVPGVHYMKNPSNQKGVAILKAGQYPKVWKIDYHAGKYLALCQRGDKFIVFRDDNRDNILDFKDAVKDYGYFGINFHKAGENSQIVGNWSAGCQVTQKSADFDKVMELAEKARKIYGNSFTYTLLKETDL